MYLCPKTVFLSRKQILNELLSKLMKKIKRLYVLPILVECHSIIANFDMWISKAGHDIFALVINFLGDDW
jgi:hypothetical protein